MILPSAKRITRSAMSRIAALWVMTSVVAPTARFTSFSLVFAAPAGITVESRIHQLAHGKLGTLDLFLSPVGRAGKEHEYLEAVFSQRV
ncbi:MAG: hypothetical protein V4630_10210 [Pseudomonadota bacterium]